MARGTLRNVVCVEQLGQAPPHPAEAAGATLVL